MYLHIYARYWHGYLLYLKPLLLLFSWQHVVWLELAVQIALLIWVLVTAIQKQNAGVAVVTLGSFLFMKPVLVLVSLTMSVCWILTLLAVEYMLLHHDRLHEKGQYPEFFLIVGILTSYFDFLTYPIVTLGIPLCCYFLLESDRLWNNIKRLTGFSVSWAIGYAGMWAAKWVIADLTLHTGTIKDAIWSIIGRTEAIGGRPRMNGGVYVIGLNLQEYPAYIGIAAGVLAAIAIGMLVMIIVTGKWKEIFAQLVPVVLTAAIPFVWIIAVQHHSALHARFTFRILSVAAAAAITFIVLNVKQAKKQQKNGLVTVVGTKKNHFMSDTKWLLQHGFKEIEKLPNGFSLLVMSFHENSAVPYFNDCVKSGECPDKLGIVAYYSNRCPYTDYYVNGVLRVLAQEINIPLKVIKLETREQAQNSPTPATIFSLFYNGKFVTTDLSICTESKFTKLLK